MPRPKMIRAFFYRKDERLNFPEIPKMRAWMAEPGGEKPCRESEMGFVAPGRFC